jgi:hypothetical protein
VELFIVLVPADANAAEGEQKELGIAAETAEQAMQLASLWALSSYGKCSCSCNETNLAINPPARVLGCFVHGVLMANMNASPASASISV